MAATGPEGLTGRLHLHTGSQHSDGSHKDVPANEKSAFLEYHRIGKVFDLKSNTTRHLPQLYSVELQRKQDSSIAYSSWLEADWRSLCTIWNALPNHILDKLWKLGQKSAYTYSWSDNWCFIIRHWWQELLMNKSLYGSDCWLVQNNIYLDWCKREY